MLPCLGFSDPLCRICIGGLSLITASHYSSLVCTIRASRSLQPRSHLESSIFPPLCSTDLRGMRSPSSRCNIVTTTKRTCFYLRRSRQVYGSLMLPPDDRRIWLFGGQLSLWRLNTCRYKLNDTLLMCFTHQLFYN